MSNLRAGIDQRRVSAAKSSLAPRGTTATTPTPYPAPAPAPAPAPTFPHRRTNGLKALPTPAIPWPPSLRFLPSSPPAPSLASRMIPNPSSMEGMTLCSRLLGFWSRRRIGGRSPPRLARWRSLAGSAAIRGC
ncbi:hypothetical protein IHE45_14G108600 [Dioscorea alata]|uniref:Uncharacterized protein n=1 Tax=Dioscorea alata TaxID=55571 RepID=A0ACB7UU87_DIOAL|nr:hypothetical protein IHE45_14G108600 [Dioscorea alata]